MITHFLGLEEVRAYARDLAERLKDLGDSLPLVWCPIGYSGDCLAHILANEIGESVEEIQTVPLAFNKESGEIELDSPETDAPLIPKASAILVLDSSIHSGATMLAVIRKLESLGAQKIITYSLVLKQSSKFIPHYFGVIVGNHDRTLFLLNAIPNNRLFKPKAIPFGVLRRLSAGDCIRKETLNTGVVSIDKTTLADLWYQTCAHGHELFVIEVAGKITSFLGLKFSEDKLLIDVVAADVDYKGKGLGGALLRWAETLARSKKCSQIELWAIEKQVPLYQHFDFEATSTALDLGDEKYFLMRRQLLYNFDLEQMKNGH